MGELTRIEDVKMVCSMCLKTLRLGDCEPDVDGDGAIGCPEPDCGGLMAAVPKE
jgi:hypothetical protein